MIEEIEPPELELEQKYKTNQAYTDNRGTKPGQIYILKSFSPVNCLSISSVKKLLSGLWNVIIRQFHSCARLQPVYCTLQPSDSQTF